jgi:hypothetical protein
VSSKKWKNLKTEKLEELKNRELEELKPEKLMLLMHKLWGRMPSCAPVANRRQAGYQPAAGWQPAPHGIS